MATVARVFLVRGCRRSTRYRKKYSSWHARLASLAFFLHSKATCLLVRCLSGVVSSVLIFSHSFCPGLVIEIKTLMPNANISTTHDPTLGSEGNCAWVSGTDPLFDKVADAWMKIMIEDFGTDHWYSSFLWFLMQQGSGCVQSWSQMI